MRMAKTSTPTPFQVVAMSLLELASDEADGVVVMVPPMDAPIVGDLFPSLVAQRVLLGFLRSIPWSPTVLVQLVGPVSHVSYCLATNNGLRGHRSGWFSAGCIRRGEAEEVIDTHWRIGMYAISESDLNTRW